MTGITINSAAVIGAGQMGREIALVLALGDIATVLYDIDGQALIDAEAHIQRALASGRHDGDAQARVRRNMRYGKNLAATAGADLFIEAVLEVAAVKTELFAKIDAMAATTAVIASNTSSLPITQLASSLPPARQKYFLGMHFSSPASRMDFMELIPGEKTDRLVIEAIAALGPRINKTITRSKDVPGFVINRLLFALMAEAQRLLEEGVASKEDIDISCRQALNHKVGPFQIMDQANNGLMLQIHEILYESYGERFAPSAALKDLVAQGRLGRSSGAGWYDYPNKS